MTKHGLSVAERFTLYVEPELNSGCWLWSGGVSSRGYGHIGAGGRGGKTISAHKFAYEQAKGPVPPGLCVLHRCDTPACVNPAHLSAGTYKDNTADMLAKGRHRSVPSGCRGESSGLAKITEADVIAIRQLSAAGHSNASLGREFDIDASNVSCIVLRKTWRHVPVAP